MIIQLTKNTFLSFGVAGKTTNEVFEQWELDAPFRPKFGRNWWFWKPTIHANKGYFRSHQTTDVNFYWLCFYACFTVYAWK